MTDDSDIPLFASLDLGSNSFHLLIAHCQRGRLQVVDRYKEMVRLASGLQADGSLSEEAMSRALDCLKRMAERLGSTPTARVHVVGTNTLRQASNADDFLAQAEEILGNPINIISGIEEARLIYRGVVHDLSPSRDLRLVVDIGGGSTELIVGDVKPVRLESLYMGCVNFSQRYFPNGNITSKNFRRARLAAREETEQVVLKFSAGNWQQAVGTSGTIRAILEILEAMGLAPGHTITSEGMEKLAEVVCESSHVDKLKLPGLSEDRRPVIAGGLAVLMGVFDELRIDQMHVSSYAIREGIILDLAGLLENHDIRNDTVADLQELYRVDLTQVSRVETMAERLLFTAFPPSQLARGLRFLRWASALHEVGLSISHAGYNRHSAYIVQNSDMHGFSRQEQKQLGFLLLNHRRKLRPMKKTYGFTPDWSLVRLFRLACLFARRRDDNALPEKVSLTMNEDQWTLSLPREWLDEHLLTAEALANEQEYLLQQDLKFELVGLDDSQSGE